MRHWATAASILLVLMTFVTFVAAAGAEEAGQKFVRGAVNTTTGWTELPLQISTQMSEDPYRGATYGFADGLSRGLKRTLWGAWDWVTFVIPPYDQPVMEPKTVFESK